MARLMSFTKVFIRFVPFNSVDEPNVEKKCQELSKIDLTAIGR
jgi:hypothetical protein